MIDVSVSAACERFQRTAWEWLQSGEITRTKHLLSPLEELCGFHFGFVYLMRVDERAVKIGFSEHPLRRMRELQPHYGRNVRLRACFVGEARAERLAHERFAHLRIRNELFLAHAAIEAYFAASRAQVRERMRELHVCTPACPQLNRRLDVRALGAWLSR